MFRFAFGFLWLLLLPAALHAQGFGTVAGRVLDAATRRPVAGALLGLPGKGLATLSNEAGVFSYKYPNVSQQELLTISALGYADFSKKALEAAADTLFLLQKKESQLLDSTVIKAHPARQLVERALAKVRDNYPGAVYALHGFYRETLRRDSAAVRLTEGVLRVEHNPAHAPDDPQPEKAKLLRGRSYDDPKGLEGLETFSFGNGAALVTHSMDMGVPEYLDGKNLNDYRFRLDSVLDAQHDRVLWRVGFAPVNKRVKAAREGTLWLDTLTLAFVRIEYDFTPEGREDVLKTTMKGLFGKVFGGARTVVQRVHGQYAYRFFSGRWYLQEAALELTADFLKPKQPRTTASTRLHFVSTEVFLRISQALRESEVLQSTEAFPRGGRYDEGFWAPFNYVKITAAERVK